MANYATSNIRTVALVGQGGSGKTTLTEALLFSSGAIKEAGTVERGTTVSDFDPLEKTSQHSLRASIVHLDTRDTRIHLVDTPGFPDFMGQAIGALDAVETAAIVVSAQSGIEMITSRTAEKHRSLAKELGVDLYLGKPFQEEELLRHLREMLLLTT